MMLIKGGKVFTMEGEVLDGGFVLIEKGRISKVGQGEPPGRYLDMAQLIDAEGMFIMPGFVDAHCHIGLFEDGIGFEGEDGNEATDPVTPHLRAIDAINPMDRAFEEAVRGGVTTAVTGPGSANVLGGEFVAIKTVGGSPYPKTGEGPRPAGHRYCVNLPDAGAAAFKHFLNNGHKLLRMGPFMVYYVLS